MKNYLLFAFLLVMSVYSVAALFSETINVGVGDSPNVEVGDSPVVEVTEDSDSPSGGNGAGGGGGSSGSSGGFVEVYNQTLEINEDGEVVESEVQEEEETTTPGITSAVIGIAKSPGFLVSTTFAVLVLALTLLIVLKKNKN